jgi:hypothetical protein
LEINAEHYTAGEYLLNARLANDPQAKVILTKSLETTIASTSERDTLIWAHAKKHLLAGDKKRALDWLERGYEEHIFMLPFINADPFFDPLRGEPRFQSLVRRLGL